MGTGQNRTKWPVTGGAVGFQPGWFPGHAIGMFYINMGYGTQPANLSNVMLGPIGFTGPTNDPYPGASICMLQVPLPPNPNYTPRVGDNATIQVVMLAQHGASLYSVSGDRAAGDSGRCTDLRQCVDITFADPKDVLTIDRTNCQNTSDIGFTTLFTASSCSATNGAMPTIPLPARLAWIPILASFAWTLLR